MNSLTISSPAKVNLFLKVLGRRPDGYHELLTLFHRISLSDRLTLRKIKRPHFRLITNHPKLKRFRANLVYRAYQLLRQLVSWKGGVEVTLEKNIPIAAGLGGGSSNAAHFLLGMNRLFRLGLPKKTVIRIGSQIGSDAPFFLHDTNQAVGTGRGEKIKPFPSHQKLWFVLVIPSFGLSTRQVYKRLRALALTRLTRAVTITSAHSDRQRIARLVASGENDLFPASCSMRPELGRINSLFEQSGVQRRLMSGSGPTIFSIHNSKREAERTARLIRDRMHGAKMFVCHTC